ncbi:YegP family protein [Luteimonas panaciterrae]|uniref:YegP family protein n=1 Tax=Luteimonas panaciterrae TaxID=363885 RepID=UPI001CFA1A21|nr:YegP family protein [Luteimonas panaciterrae]
MAGKFEISKRSNGEFQFVLKAGNGQVILTSEGYSAKASCTNGVESVRKNSQDDQRYDRKTASNGKLFFNLTASNGQVIGSSQMYADDSGRGNGIASVKENAPGATVDDQTA